MDKTRIKMEPRWRDMLLDEFSRPYIDDLRDFIKARRRSGAVILPPYSDFFTAFNLTPFDKVKVVMLGQDPYHGPDQAHGLCFSVKPGIPVPPSLQNMYKELQADIGFKPPRHGYLESWARQGVFMMNAILSVEMGRPTSHRGKGWEIFTDRVIQILNEQKENLVFLLWGSYAQKKGAFIDRKRHLVLEAPHPSPLSASRGFFGCRHFSRTNEWLKEKGLEPINWNLPELSK